MFQFPEFASNPLFYSGVDTLFQYLETIPAVLADDLQVCFVFALSQLSLLRSRRGAKRLATRYRTVSCPAQTLCRPPIQTVRSSLLVQRAIAVPARKG